MDFIHSQDQIQILVSFRMLASTADKMREFPFCISFTMKLFLVLGEALTMSMYVGSYFCMLVCTNNFVFRSIIYLYILQRRMNIIRESGIFHYPP
jgi:hypothetical protein